MIVRIDASPECPEWALIELQGELDLGQDSETLVRQGFDVGTLRREGEAVFLTVGYHQLDGRVVPLKKPLLILEKAARGEDYMGEGRAGEEVAYKPVGVLRSKILFKNRPRALISKPEVPAGKR